MDTYDFYHQPCSRYLVRLCEPTDSLSLSHAGSQLMPGLDKLCFCLEPCSPEEELLGVNQAAGTSWEYVAEDIGCRVVVPADAFDRVPKV